MEVNQLNNPLSGETNQEQVFAQAGPQTPRYNTADPDSELDGENETLKDWLNNTTKLGRILYYASIVTGLVGIIGNIAYRINWAVKIPSDKLVEDSDISGLIIAPAVLLFLAAFLYIYVFIIAFGCKSVFYRCFLVFIEFYF